jgi:hypothetical protein
MEWIYTKDRKPLTYKTGHWDGKNSDQVIAEDKDGKRYLTHYCEGFMDGSSFEEWWDSSDWEITNEIVRYLQIPD